jgi:hypothetical protein
MSNRNKKNLANRIKFDYIETLCRRKIIIVMRQTPRFLHDF